jgi:hypothetical protein
MWLFGGPNFEKLIVNKDYKKLTDILISSNNDKYNEQASKAFVELGSEGTAHLVSTLLNPKDLEKTATQKIRAQLQVDSNTAHKLLVKLLKTGVNKDAVMSAIELGWLGNKDAIPHLISFLDIIEMKFGRNKALISKNERLSSVMFKAALFTNTVEALHKLGSDVGLVVLIRLLKNNENMLGMQCETTLMQLTGKDFELELNSEAWIDWWHSQGRSLDEEIMPNKTFAQKITQLALAVGAEPSKILDESNVQFVCTFPDNRSQTVNFSLESKLDSHSTLNAHTMVAKLDGDKTTDLITSVLKMNAQSKVGMFQIEEIEGVKYLEFGQKLILETLTPNYFAEVLKSVSGIGDDMEEKISGTDHY